MLPYAPGFARSSSLIVDAPPMSIRADVASINPEARAADVIFSTGAAVERFDWLTGKKYREVLSMKADHIRLVRLNAGAPLLDAHSAWSVTSQLGAVVRGTARLDGKKAMATVRFSKRADVEPIFQDVRDGIISAVSVGYRVHRFEETDAPRDGGMPTRVATDWEPYEISLVPMPADVGAKVRDGDRTLTNSCVIVTLAADADRQRRLALARARAV